MLRHVHTCHALPRVRPPAERRACTSRTNEEKRLRVTGKGREREKGPAGREREDRKGDDTRAKITPFRVIRHEGNRNPIGVNFHNHMIYPSCKSHVTLRYRCARAKCIDVWKLRPIELNKSSTKCH